MAEGPSGSGAVTARSNLPSQLTTFYGRRAELTELATLRRSARLLTLIGHGGSGKTRLALESVQESLSDYRDGVWFIDLAPLTDPALVPSAVAAVVGVLEDPDLPLAETLVKRLRSRHLLLMLDNCEHLLDAAAELAQRMLESCPHATVVATSRRSLSVPGEVLFQVLPLSLPPVAQRPSLSDLRGSDAVSLFTGRAASFQPGFELTDENAADIAEICQRLDGLPLAIELAAARIQTIPLSGLVRRLDDRFRLLATASRAIHKRQRTLEATIDWSYTLLPELERLLLRRLSIFSGGWDLEAAENVCGFGQIEMRAVVEMLASLVDASLVVMQKGRYRLLESIRQYAKTRDDAAAELESLERRRAEHFAAICQEALQTRGRASETEWVRRLEADHDNIRAALRWCSENDIETGSRIAVGASMLWWVRGHLSEGRYWPELFLARSTSRDTVRAGLAEQAGWVAQSTGDFEAAHRHYAEAIATGRALNNTTRVASTLARLGSLYRLQGNLAAARKHCEEATELFRSLNEPGWLAWSTVHLAAVMAAEGDIHGGRAVLEEGIRWARLADAPREIELVAAVAGIAALLEGDHPAAKAFLREALHASLRADDLSDVIYGLELAAAIASAADRRYSRALRLAGACAAIKELTGLREDPHFTAYVERLVEPARTALGVEAASRAWDRGKAMSLPAAIQYALEPEDVPEAAIGALTKREIEVAALVAEGHTARQIGERLFIAERTVESHIERIRNKLGVRSRAQIASWVVQQRWLRN